jgi:hypothetical protein
MNKAINSTKKLALIAHAIASINGSWLSGDGIFLHILSLKPGKQLIAVNKNNKLSALLTQ